MKKSLIVAGALLLFATPAFAQFGPGPGPAPSSGGLSAIANNSVLANVSGGSAVPSGLSIAACTGGSSALTWVSGTGFGCQTGLAAGAGLGANTFTDTQTITEGTALHSILASTGFSSTGSDVTPMINVAGTLNTSGAIDVMKFALTCTACGSANLLNIYGGASGTTSEFKLGATGAVTIAGGFQGGGTSTFSWTGRGFLSSPAAQQVQFGAASSATPLSQTVLTQGSRGGTDSNVSGGNLTIQAGDGTGNSTTATLTLQTPHVAASGTTQQTMNTQITLGDNTVSMPNIASSSAATTGTVCWTTGGNLTVDTTLACLSSTRRVKHKIENLDPVVEGERVSALKEINALRPVSYDLKPEFNPKHLGRQIGLVAEEVQAVDPRLVGLDAIGKVEGVRYMQLTALLVKALQEEEAKNAALEIRVEALEHRPQ
jgi:hypothetical protein